MVKTSVILFNMLFLIATSAIAQIKTLNSIKGESSATYLLVHPMHEIEATSKEMVYTVTLQADTKIIQTVTAAVDVTSFDSENSSRDSHAMEVIDALSFPEVTFTSSSIVTQGNSLIVAGKLTFHGVTNDVTAIAIPEWGSDKLNVHATMPVSLTAFKVERPSLLFIPVQDTLRFKLSAAFSLK